MVPFCRKFERGVFSMPIECSILDKQPEPIKTCPKCGCTPFETFMRGMIQRRKRKWWLFGERWPYCAVICWGCKEIVGYEQPEEASDE
jgi:hypothetical protein